jgi:hypothetical protein
MRVKIKQLPKKAYGGQQAGGALNVTPNDFNGNYSKAKEGREVKQSLISVPRPSANLEAEGGETAFGPISGDTIPDHFKITGPRHHSGGVPLNLPEDTFIFSDTKAMKITDPSILKMFGKTPKKGGYTPAELAKPYDINSYKAILMDPDSDRKSKETATLMIKNYIMKLGALALAQESKKGFPQGIPEMARPYMEANNITDEDLIVQEAPEGAPAEQPLMKNGGLQEFKGDDPTKGSSVIPKQRDATGNWVNLLDSLNDYNTWIDQSAEQQALAEYNKYMNRTNDLNVSTLVNYTPDPNSPVYQAILKKYKGQSNNINNIDPYNFYGNSGFINNSNGNFYNSNSNAEIFPFYNTGNAGRYNLDFSNPFSNRAFRRAGNYLTPMGASRITGPGLDNIPISGFPQDAKLTSIDWKYKKNPLLKALLNRDIARKELEYKFNFNGDLSKFTDDVDIEDVDIEDVETDNVETDNVETDNVETDNVETNQEFINNGGENVVDPEELDWKLVPLREEDLFGYDENIDPEDVEVEDQDTDVPPYGGLMKDSGFDEGKTYRNLVAGPNMQKAFGGENQMLNTFVYGGNYVHGGFHSPIEQDEDPPYGGLVINNPMVDINDGMNNGNLTTDYANAGPGQLTADLIDNQSDKNAVAKILNINDNKEEEEEDSFSIEGKQKINTAWDFNPEDLRQQSLYVADLVTDFGNEVQKVKEDKSRFNKYQKYQQNANVSQGNFYGTDLVNTPGVFATASVSYPNLMRSLGTTPGQFGGSIPMAKYGANMGGSYYPTMSTGGSSRVRIKSLPSKDGGGTPGHAHPHSLTTTYIGGSPEWADWYKSDNSKDYRTSGYNAYKARRDATGNTALDEDSYEDIFNRAQRQIYGMKEFYKDNPEYLNTKDWDSEYAYKDGKKDLSVNKGKNWKYKATLKEMNDKLREDNPNISQEELDKKLYTELTNDEISNFQSAYIAGKQVDASGGKTGDALTKYIHTGVNDQTVTMADGTVENISPEDDWWGNTTNQEGVTNRIGEKGELDTSTGLINCVCYPLDPETGLEDKSKPAISTTQIKEGEECPCSATVTQKGENSSGDTPDEPYRYSRQDGRNLLTAARYETQAARISPFLTNNREISPVLVNPYTGDITAQIKAGMTGINTGGGSTATKQALRMQMLGKGTEATGGRFATTRDANATAVNQGQQFNLNAKSQNDGRNQQAINTTNEYNAGAEDASMKGRNAKMANENLTEQAASGKLQRKAFNNIVNANMKISYSNDLPYFTAKYRDAMLNPNVTADNTDVNKTKTKTKTKNSKYGGSVNSNTFIPRYTTMPYDN